MGSRFVDGGSLDTTGWRRLLSIFGNKFIKIVFGINSNEFTTAFRGYNLKKLEGFDLRDVKSKGYSFFMETIYLLDKRNTNKYLFTLSYVIKERQKLKGLKFLEP